MKCYSILKSLVLLMVLSGMARAAVIFDTSGGFLTGIRFTEPLNFTVIADHQAMGQNGYELVTKGAYAGLSGFRFTETSGPDVSIHATRSWSSGSAVGDYDFNAYQVARGTDGGGDGELVGGDLTIRFNRSGDLGNYNATVGEPLVIPNMPEFVLSDLTEVEAPNNLGNQVTVFMVATTGSGSYRVTGDLIIDVIPEPSAASMLMLAGVGGLLRRRKS